MTNSSFPALESQLDGEGAERVNEKTILNGKFQRAGVIFRPLVFLFE